MNEKPKDRLKDYPNVVGVSEDREKKEYRVYVTKKLPIDELSIHEIIPEKIRESNQDFTTDVIEIGEIEIQIVKPGTIHKARTRRERWEKPHAGVSCGHFEITAGTLGLVAKKGEDKYIITNAHVGANSGRAKRGDPILQPGPHDSGRLVDVIAHLTGYEPVEDGMRWDFCYCKHDPSTRDISANVVGIGHPTGLKEPTVGMKVITSGRTAPEISRGECIDTGVDVRVNYGEGLGKLWVKNCNLYSPISQPGDSGSGIFELKSNKVVDLLFGGSKKVTVGIGELSEVLEKNQLELITNSTKTNGEEEENDDDQNHKSTGGIFMQIIDWGLRFVALALRHFAKFKYKLGVKDLSKTVSEALADDTINNEEAADIIEALRKTLMANIHLEDI